MHRSGLYLVLGLPNSTSCIQERDQLYQEFKGKTRAMIDELFSDKLAHRSSNMKSLKEEFIILGFNGNFPNTGPTTPVIKVLLERLKDSLKTPSLNNNDLSLIIDGKPGGSPLLSPFESTFTK